MSEEPSRMRLPGPQASATAEVIAARHDLTILAAHAPAVPDWFTPDCRGEPRCPRRALFATMPNALAGRTLESWIRDVEKGRRRSMTDDPEMATLARREDEGDRARAAWCVASSERWLEYVVKRDAWLVKRARVAMAQWPFFYAAMVVEARSDGDGVAGMGA